MVWASGIGNTRNNWANSGTSTDTQCPFGDGQQDQSNLFGTIGV